MPKPLLSPEEATTFDNRSAKNAAKLIEISQLNGCACAPYEDWFTYNRWLAQGYQVKKGEHGTQIFINIEKEIEIDGEKKTFLQPRTHFVFCRCQVEKITNNQEQ